MRGLCNAWVGLAHASFVFFASKRFLSTSPWVQHSSNTISFHSDPNAANWVPGLFRVILIVLKLQNQKFLSSFLSDLCNFQSKEATWINLLSWHFCDGCLHLLVKIWSFPGDYFFYCKDVSLNQIYIIEVLITIRNSQFSKDLIPMRWHNPSRRGSLEWWRLVAE